MNSSTKRCLIIECATQACSVALFEDNQLIGSFHEVIGRGHAEKLVPAIADLPDKGRADQIRVSLGPGSFTGVRIGIAAARALALAWEAEITGYPTLSLIAAMAQGEAASSTPVTIAMRGGHGEWFMQDFTKDGLPQTDLRSLPPEAAANAALHNLIAGDQADALVELRGNGTPCTHLPDARHALAIPNKLFGADLRPIYGRAPDAKPAKTRTAPTT